MRRFVFDVILIVFYSNFIIKFTDKLRKSFSIQNNWRYSSLEIKHDKNNQRFFSIVDGRESYLQYLKIDDSTLDYYKTYVPNELRGKGIAGKIVESALNYALQNNLIIIPSCSYVDTFIERHPDYNKIVKK